MTTSEFRTRYYTILPEDLSPDPPSRNLGFENHSNRDIGEKRIEDHKVEITKPTKLSTRVVHQNLKRKNFEREVKEDAEKNFVKLLNLDPLSEDVELDEAKIAKIIKNNPELCLKKFSFDAISKDPLYPLHVLCCLGASYSLVRKCYECYPEAIDRASHREKMTCLHYACKYTRSPLKAISFLVRKQPQLIDSVNSEKQTPLHVACMCSPTLRYHDSDVVVLLTELGSQAATKTDKNGNTPLHLACMVDHPSYDVVQDLTATNSDACTMLNENKLTPLHLACANQDVAADHNEVESVIKDLVKSNKKGLKIRNGNGDLPIFVAIANNANYKVCKYLLKKYHDCLFETNTLGENPYQFAKYKKMSESTIKLLYPYETDDESESEGHSSGSMGRVVCV